jgi:hypothetical protein
LLLNGRGNRANTKDLKLTVFEKLQLGIKNKILVNKLLQNKKRDREK